MQIIVPVVEGFAASVRDDKNTISEVIRKYLSKYDEDSTYYAFFNSASKTVGTALRDYIKHSGMDMGYYNTSLLLVGKSYGAVVVHDFLKKNWELVNRFYKICFLCIDGHSPFFFHWLNRNYVPTVRYTIFGYGKYRSLRNLKKWRKSNKFRLFNVYQQNEYPEGAKVKHADKQERLGTGADHWNIVFSMKVKQFFNQLMVWATIKNL